MMQRRNRTRTAVVVGGAGGLGRAIVGYLTRDHRVAVLDADRNGLKELARERPGSADRVYTGWVDLESEESIAGAFRKVFEDLGPTTVLINAAGVPPGYSSVQDTDRRVLSSVLETNCVGPWRCAAYALPSMMEAQWGRIVNVTSVIASGGWRFRSDYAASKAALTSVTQTLAVEVAPFGITVNAVAPGHMRTPMTRDKDIDWAGLTARIPLGRLVTVEEVAAVVGFLVSDAAAAVTGVTIPVDGGYLVNRSP